MTDTDFNIIKTPALGRPFRLGMLYDRIHDTIMPGETLLTMKEIDNHTYKANKHGCSFEIIYGDSLEDKSTVYKGDANLEINVMKGAAALGCSGNFLKSNILKKKELRVSLTADYTTYYKELEMKQFESLISKTKTNATHIVTAIEYGTKVTFTFDRTLSEGEDALEIGGQLKGMIEKIPMLKVSGSLEGSMSEIEKKKTENISCKFCGDVILPRNPTTYEDAVICYRELPVLIKEDDAVPVTAWLYPIPTKSTTANMIVKTINRERMKHAVNTLEGLQRMYVSCNDLMLGQAIALIPEVQFKIDQFRRNVQSCLEEFQDQVLGELFKEENLSAEKNTRLHQITNMKHWLSDKAEREINLLNIYINEIKKGKIEILEKSVVDAKLFEHDNVIILDIVLPFSSGKYGEKTNGEIQQHGEEEKPYTGDRSSFTDEIEKAWYDDQQIKTIARTSIKRFITLNSRTPKHYEYFVTFTDRKNIEQHDRISSCAHAVWYKNGDENREVGDLDVLSPDNEKLLYAEITD